MQFNRSNFSFNTPESWLVLLIYGGFWLYSYYSLAVCLIHTRKQNRLLENSENLS